MRALYVLLARAVAFDQMMMRVIKSGNMVGFYHEGGIALAPGAAAGAFLRKEDVLWPHYRAHGIAHLLSKGIDIKPYIAEHMGRLAGCCKGRSSFHFSFPEHHVFGYSGNIGANFPASVGHGFAAVYKKGGQVVMSCSGDGSYGEGRAHEAMLMAANWKLPVIFWCESNGVAQYSAIGELFPQPQISGLAGGFGIPSLVVDGQDLFACGEAALRAIDHCRGGNGPIFVELMTLRAQEHNVGGFNHAGTQPRDQALMDQWKMSRDPLKLAAARLTGNGVLGAAGVEQIAANAVREAAAAEAYCEGLAKAEPSIAEMQAAVYCP
jgi:TPP-dependent pyruvate/acetoin dehydrogenase alpha subunit